MTTLGMCLIWILFMNSSHAGVAVSLRKDLDHNNFSFNVEWFLKKDRKSQVFDERLRNYQMYKDGIDESGKIMFVMYHRVRDDHGYYSRGIEDFKSDLEKMYSQGYHLISLQSYLNNSFEVPYGRTPIILTFDDGDISNFRFITKDNQIIIDPDCVVGILDNFYDAHPEFGRHAVFYVNKDNPFGQPQYLGEKIEYLITNGYEIGNHTTHHASLKTLNKLEIEHAIGENVAYFSTLNENLTLDSLSLPFGERPSDETLIESVFSGYYEDVSYSNRIAFLVGWRPEKPLYDFENSPRFLNRVQSGDGIYQLGYWLDYFIENPEEKFISDGDSGVITLRSTQNVIIENALLPVKIIDFNIMGGKN